MESLMLRRILKSIVASLAERWLDPHHEPSKVPYRGSGNVSAFHCQDCARKAATHKRS
jgi:hypothetical protein